MAWESHLQIPSVEQNVDGLGDVGGVDVVVEGVGLVVVVLQGGDEGDEGAAGDLEDAEEVAVAEDGVGDGCQRTVLHKAVQHEQIHAPRLVRGHELEGHE